MRMKLKDDPRVIKEKEKGLIIIGRIIQFTYSEPLYSVHKEISRYQALPGVSLPFRVHAFPAARCLIRNNFPGGKKCTTAEVILSGLSRRLPH